MRLKNISNLCFLFFLLFQAHTTSGQPEALRVQLNKTISSVQAVVGVSVIDLATNDTVSVNGQGHFPMQSVFKFHLALAVLDQVDKGKLKMDQIVKISKHEYYPTHSPIMKKYPDGTELPLQEVLKYTTSWSDNIGCDVLFRVVGGSHVVNDYIHALGIRDVEIIRSEKEMLQEWDFQFENWTTPNGMAALLRKFYLRQVLSIESSDFLWQAMVDSPLGPKRIKGMLPEGTVVGHRTGTGGPNAQGVHGAVNDAGIVQLPDGRKLILVVFVSRSADSYANLENLIARISKDIYDHFTGN